MQVKNNPGKAAKGMSQAEFCDKMKEMVMEIGVRLHDKLPTEKARHMEESLLFSYDNAAFHKCPERLLWMSAGPRAKRSGKKSIWGTLWARM